MATHSSDYLTRTEKDENKKKKKFFEKKMKIIIIRGEADVGLGALFYTQWPPSLSLR